MPAICGDMYLRTPTQGDQFARIVARYGFETLARGACWRPTVWHRLGENVLIVLLVLVTNPIVLRSALRPFHRRVFLSRGVLERYYGASCEEPGVGAGASLHARSFKQDAACLPGLDPPQRRSGTGSYTA